MVLPSGKMRLALAFLFVILSVNFLVAQKIRDNNAGPGQQMVPNGDGSATAAAIPTGQAVVTGNGINYNGGPVLKGNPVPIYIIWYGNWNGTGSNTATTQNLIQGFLSSTSLGGSSYEAINTTYGDNSGNVSGHLNFVQATTDTGSQGTRLRNSKISAAISAKLTSGALPTDPNGVYLFITSSDVKERADSARSSAASTRLRRSTGPISSGRSSATLTSAPAVAKSRAPARTVLQRA
jgi:hypothetical protein